MRLFCGLIAVLVGLSLISCTGARKREQVLKDAELHYQLGDGAFRDHQISVAIKELIQAIEGNPGHAEAHHLLGFIYMGRQDYEIALQQMQQAVALKADFLEAKNNLGACYLALCRWSEAEAVFRELESNPLYQTPYIAQNNLGLALLQQGKAEEALRHFQRAVFLDPSFCVGFNNMGMALLELDRLEEAQRALNGALTADPSCTEHYAEPHFHLGRMYERAGRPDAAMTEYQRCQELTKGDLTQGYGCGQSPLGLRCEQKLRQLGQAAGGR